MLTKCIYVFEFTTLLTYSMEQSPSREANWFGTSQEIPRIFGTRRFITVLTSARHLSLSWANSIQSSQPPPTSWRSILILSSHLRLGLASGLFPSGFPTRTLCTNLPPKASKVPNILKTEFKLWQISDFRREVDKKCVILGYDAECSGNS